MLTRAASIVCVAGLALLVGCAGAPRSSTPATYEGTPTASEASSGLLDGYVGRWAYHGRYLEGEEWKGYTMRADARAILDGNFVEVRLGDPADPAGLTWIGDDPEEGVTFVTLSSGDGRTYVVNGGIDEQVSTIQLAEAVIALPDQAPLNEPTMLFEEVIEEGGGRVSRTYVASVDGPQLIDEASAERTGPAGATVLPTVEHAVAPLDRLAGVWHSQAWNLQEDGDWVPATSTTTMRPVLGGAFLVGDWADTNEAGEVTTRGVVTVGLGANGQLILTTRTNMDRQTWVWVGTWDGDVLTAWPAEVTVPGGRTLGRPPIWRVEEFGDDGTSTVHWYRRVEDGTDLLIAEENVTRSDG